MKVFPTTNNDINFRHKILIDIGASNPKGTLKIRTVINAKNSQLWQRKM